MVELEDTKLHEAVRLGDSSLVEEALRNGLDPDAIGLYQWCPLHEAASNGDLEVVELLVKFKADPNKPDKLHASTPVHYAAKEGHADCLQVLIKAGGKFDVQNGDGVTPLDIAEDNCREILDRERTKQFIELSLVDARKVIHKTCSKESLTDSDFGTSDDKLKKSLMGQMAPVAWESIEVIDKGKQSLKETGTGLLQASFEYNSKSGAFKIRVWQIEDILLPPAEFSSISRIYVKSHLLPDKKGDTKRRTEEIKIDDGTKMESSFITLKKKSAAEGYKAIFLPSTFKFVKPLVYKDIQKDMLPLKTVHLDICVRLKYRTKSLPVASFQISLKEAVRKLRKEKFRVLPCINYSAPDNIHTTDENDFVIVMEGMYANRTLSNPMLRKKAAYNLAKEELPERAMSDIQLKSVRAQSVESIPTVSVSLSSEEGDSQELTEVKVHRRETDLKEMDQNASVTIVDIHQEETSLPGSTEDVFMGVKVDTTNSVAVNRENVRTVEVGQLESETIFNSHSDWSGARKEEGQDVSIPRILITAPDGSHGKGESVAIEMGQLLRQKMKMQMQSQIAEKRKSSSRKSKRNIDSFPKPGHVVDLRTTQESGGSEKEEKHSASEQPSEHKVNASTRKHASKERVLKNVQRKKAEQKTSRNTHENITEVEREEGLGGGSPDVSFKTISEEEPKPQLSPSRSRTSPNKANASGRSSSKNSSYSGRDEWNMSETSLIDVVDETRPKEQLSPRLKAKLASSQENLKGDIPPSPLLVKEVNELHQRSKQSPTAGEERLKMPRARRSMNFGITPPLTKGMRTTDLVSPGQTIPLRDVSKMKSRQINKNLSDAEEGDVEKMKLSQVST